VILRGSAAREGLARARALRITLREPPWEWALGTVALWRLPHLAVAPIDGAALSRKQSALLAQPRAGAADLPPRLESVAAQLGAGLLVGAACLQAPQPVMVK
jgi:hypothetical protein